MVIIGAIISATWDYSIPTDPICPICGIGQFIVIKPASRTNYDVFIFCHCSCLLQGFLLVAEETWVRFES